MKEQQPDKIAAIPSKRLFSSIIADYDLNRAICELIDNALDKKLQGTIQSPVIISIELDENQKLITVTDNAGGIKKSELHCIVGPGQTSNVPTEEIIGIFGVGTKRAVVALGQDITIISRFKSQEAYLLEFDDDWLNEEENWELPYYKVDGVPENNTIVRIQRLRIHIDGNVIALLKRNLGAVYARFINDAKVQLSVNGDKIRAISFEDWAYPPKYPPHKYVSHIRTPEGDVVNVEILAGLIKESSPASGEYGVYVYCNDRLIAPHLKSYDVGFTRGQAGQPHPMVSLVRVLVSLKGPAKLMPWNSSKSDIYPSHPIFASLHDFLVQVVKDYASLSRRLAGRWSEEVFKYKSGKITEVRVEDLPKTKTSYLPPLPVSKPRYIDIVKQKNLAVSTKKPWTRGLYEGIIATDFIYRQKLDQKNRISLILLDSTLEIAFKEYLVNESPKHYTDDQLSTIFRKRHLLEQEMKKHITLPKAVWPKIKYYHGLRNDLIHKRSTTGPSDNDIEDYRKVVEQVLHRLYTLNF